MDVTTKTKLNIVSDYSFCIDPKKYATTVKPTANHIHCDTTGKYLGYRDLVKMDEQVWTNSMCNEIGHLSQGCKKHAGLKQNSLSSKKTNQKI